jgi:uncharacterized protein
MPGKRSHRLRCPTCKQAVNRSDADFPFCSERCRLIDLGKWASGAYVIASPVTDQSDTIDEKNPEDSGKNS